MKCFCTTFEALYTKVRMAPQAAGFCRSGRVDFLLAQKYELLQSNSRLLGCERVMETRAEFHFSWVYAFSATLSSLRKWANNDKYRLRPSTPAQLCWSSSRMQPLPNYNLIKFALIRPSTLNHDSNLWNFWGALDGRTCFCKFFSVPQRLNFIFAWNCLMFVPINSRSLSLSAMIMHTLGTYITVEPVISLQRLERIYSKNLLPITRHCCNRSCGSCIAQSCYLK